MTTTTRADAATAAIRFPLALLLIVTTSSVVTEASNPYNYTPSISLLDGSGEVNSNGFCLRLISNHPLADTTTTIDCTTSTSGMDSATVMGSSCLESADEGTQFGYDEVDQTIYAVNVFCDNDEDDVNEEDNDIIDENEEIEDIITSITDTITAVTSSKSGGKSTTTSRRRRTCLTAESPISEGSGLILTECYNNNNNNNNNSTSTENMLLMQQQTFIYTSSGKFLINAVADDHDGYSTTPLCLGMDDFIWQQGAPSPYVDPTFWRELTLMDCNNNNSNATDSTHHALMTWLVNPTPTLNVLEDGPFPGTGGDDTTTIIMEDDGIVEEDEIDSDMDDDDSLLMIGHQNNTMTGDGVVVKPSESTVTATASVAKKTGSNIRRRMVLDDGMS